MDVKVKYRLALCYMDEPNYEYKEIINDRNYNASYILAQLLTLDVENFRHWTSAAESTV
jgi:hypothetical protein